MTRALFGPFLFIACGDCGRSKDHRKFYRHPSCKYGRMKVCKLCHCRNATENRALKIEVRKAYDASRPMTPERREQMRRYAKSKRGRARHAEANRVYRLTHPEKYRELNRRSAEKLRIRRGSVRNQLAEA